MLDISLRSTFIPGRIHSGMLIVKRIGQVECDNSDRPVDQVKIIGSRIIN